MNDANVANILQAKVDLMQASPQKVRDWIEGCPSFKSLLPWSKIKDNVLKHRLYEEFNAMLDTMDPR